MFEYDPCRTTLLSLVAYTNGVFSYRLAPHGILTSAIISNINFMHDFEDRQGYTASLAFIKPGTPIYAFEHKYLSMARFVRAAGTFAKLVSNSLLHSIIKLRSKFLLRVSNKCTATAGILSTRLLFLKSHKFDAGRSRRLGKRPHVRGVAMNPIDHPHGGGQGKTSGGRASVTPWAEITKGKKTSRKNNYGTFILKR